MRIPSATYRVQFNKDFTFKDAEKLVPSLHRLGITHLYCSPIWAAREESTHGYDVTDPNRLNPALGSAADFDALHAQLASKEMGTLLDIVPNHMAASPENAWWMDVLESGAASPYANFFGVNWSSFDQNDGGKIFLPILGEPYGTVLDKGELKLSYGPFGFALEYYEHKVPITPSSYEAIFEGQASEVSEVGELQSLIQTFRALSLTSPGDWEASQSLLEEKRQAKRRLSELVENNSKVRQIVDASLESLAGTPGVASSFDRLHDLLQRQTYRVAFWRVATERINYRRFFDVTDLIGIRVEDERVFDTTHELIRSLVTSRKADGLRVDHIDGLADPKQYLDRLPDDTYVLVEKILADSEALPRDWKVQGTSGYDFLGYVNSFFVEPDGLEQLRSFYVAHTGFTKTLKDVEYERQILIIDTLFPGEMADLGSSLAWLAEQDRYARDLSPRDLALALKQLTACMGVYRTYTRSFEVSDQDLTCLRQAVEEAESRYPDVNSLAYRFALSVLQLKFSPKMDETAKQRWLSFVQRWQQLSGPIMAKGVEDSAFYVYNVLVSMNEVGGVNKPVSAEQMHSFLLDRRRLWPHTMNATSTHDTKRSEDVRARINALPEFAAEWTKLVTRWSRWMGEHRKSVDRNEEYLLLQNLLGAWPLQQEQVDEYRERIKAYSTKAAREAREHTSWLVPSEDHEEHLHKFIDALFADKRFLDSFVAFQTKTAFYGAVNSLSQTLLKMAAPGVPDFYRGTLAWDFSLVDPDNRRPVEVPTLTDFAQSPRELLTSWENGGVKVFLTEKVLAFRKANLPLFAEGEYLPLEVVGKRRDHVFAFARKLGERWVIVVIPRFASKLSTVLRFPTGVTAWRDTILVLPPDAPQNWRNIITNARLAGSAEGLAVHRVLDAFPVALLVSK